MVVAIGLNDREAQRHEIKERRLGCLRPVFPKILRYIEDEFVSPGLESVARKQSFVSAAVGICDGFLHNASRPVGDGSI